MIKRVGLTMLLLITTVAIYAQYYNRIIPFPFGAPTVAEMETVGNSIYIPVIYPGNVSTLINVYNDFDFSYTHFQSFDFASQATKELNSQLYLYAKDRTKPKGLRMAVWNGRDTTKWMREYATEGEYNFPNASTSLNGNIYIGFFEEYDGGSRKEIAIKKIDTSGNEIWYTHYNTDGELNYLWELENAQDQNLFASTSIHYYDRGGRFGRIVKLDENGDVIWEANGTEKFSNGATPVWIAPLSNGEIIQAYELERIFDQEFINNNWNPFPIRLRWYDQDGNPIRSKLLINEKYSHWTIFDQIEAGRGDYFYAYGSFDDDDEAVKQSYGLVVKYDNQGNVIWKRKYKHPDYLGSRITYYIKDVIEQENGNLIMVGAIIPRGEKGEVWLMKTNANGCFGGADCGDVVVTDVDEIDTQEAGIWLYPNPAKDEIILNESLESYRIVNLQGQELLKGINYAEHTVIDVSGLSRGVYLFLGVHDQYGLLRRKFVVE